MRKYSPFSAQHEFAGLIHVVHPDLAKCEELVRQIEMSIAQFNACSGTTYNPTTPSPGDGSAGGDPDSPLDPLPEGPAGGGRDLTAHEMSVFKEIDSAKKAIEEIFENATCYGTKRMGNYYFNGTKEHWLIQMDYLTKHADGDIEFSIPSASGAGTGNRGFVDIVDLGDGSMFEIKPNNPQGQSAGATEVANYVAMAKQYCTTTLPTGAQWHAGNDYKPVSIPTGIAGRYLLADYLEPGVIGYKYSDVSDPSPLPIPQSVVEKLRHLAERLRDNLWDGDRIIADYLYQNPDLKNYLKSMAIGASSAIVIMTIVEDFATAGVGLADDAASFALAFRIMNYALKI